MANLGKLIFDSGERSADLRYAAGFSTPDDFVWFQAQDMCAVVMSPLEYNRARSFVKKGTAVLSDKEAGGPNLADMAVYIAKQYRLNGFLVPKDFPLLQADKIRSRGLMILPAEGDFFPEREYKDPEEVEKITYCLRAAESGCRRAIEVLRQTQIAQDNTLIFEGEPLTSEMLRYEIDSTMMKMGMLATGTICAGGFQGSQPHNTGSGVLYAHAPIVMDIFPRSAENGYWGDLTRTVVRGNPSNTVRKAYDAVLEAREYAKQLIAPGANPAEIHRAAAKVLEKHGFYTGHSEKGDYGFFHGLGHGVGLDIHEAPRLSPRGTVPLEPGVVVTVEPGLYYPEWGGIRLEDMVWLSPAGKAQCLTEIEDFLIV